MPTTSLFDEFPADRLIISNTHQSGYEFLNTTSEPKYAPLRSMFNDWFSRFPEKDKKDLCSRFRSPIETSHQGAFFELLVHELHLRLDSEVTTHRETELDNRKTPDFFVIDSDMQPSYVEATVVTGKSLKQEAAEARLSDIVDALNRSIISPNFWLSMKQQGLPRALPSVKNAARKINSEIAKLDYEKIVAARKAGDTKSLPKWSFNFEGCTLTFEPFPKGEFARGNAGLRPIALGMGDMRKVDNRSPIRKTITRKANRYGKLNHQFVVALSCLELVDDIDIMEALFGQEQFHVPIEINREVKPEEITFSRKPDGAWTSPFGPQYSRISAVLVAVYLRPWSIKEATICLYHNPWAEINYSSVLGRLDQAVLSGKKMERIQGESLSELLQLDSYLQ